MKRPIPITILSYIIIIANIVLVTVALVGTYNLFQRIEFALSGAIISNLLETLSYTTIGIISAIALLKGKDWARFVLLFSAIPQIIYYSFTIFLIEDDYEKLGFVLIILLFSFIMIYFLFNNKAALFFTQNKG